MQDKEPAQKCPFNQQSGTDPIDPSHSKSFFILLFRKQRDASVHFQKSYGEVSGIVAPPASKSVVEGHPVVQMQFHCVSTSNRLLDWLGQFLKKVPLRFTQRVLHRFQDATKGSLASARKVLHMRPSLVVPGRVPSRLWQGSKKDFQHDFEPFVPRFQQAS